MNSSYLRTFVEVIQTGSITKAAENLLVTQPAITKRIKLLEQYYGIELLNRTEKMIEPTKFGVFVFENGKKIISIEETIKKESIKQINKNDISFCSTITFWKAHFPALLRDFSKKIQENDRCVFRFDYPSEILESLNNGVFNMAFIEHCSNLNLSGYKCYDFPKDEIVFISSPKLGITEKFPEIYELLDFVLYGTNITSCSVLLLEKNLGEKGKSLDEFKNKIFCGDIDQIIENVENGNGLCFLSKSLVREQLERGILISHRVVDFDHYKSRTFVTRKDYQLAGKSKEFATHIFEMFNLDFPPSD